MGAIVIRTRYDEGTESAEVATSVYRSTLFGIFLKPESKQKYLLVEQMQLSFIFAISQFKYLFCNIKGNACFNLICVV